MRRLELPDALIVTAGFVAVATGFHVTPAAAVILGLVEKEPGAIVGGALAHKGKIVREQQVSGAAGDGPDDGLKVVLGRNPFPGETARGVDNAPMGRGLLHGLIQLIEGRDGNSPASGDRAEQGEDRLAQQQRGAQDIFRLARGAGRQLAESIGVLAGEGASLLGPGHEVVVVMQRLARMLGEAAVEGVGEIEAEMPARQIEARLGMGEEHP